MAKTKTVGQLVDSFKELLDYYEVAYPTNSDTVLEIEIKSAIGAINRCRRFTPSSTELYDAKYEDKILPLALTAFMKNGAEGESKHSENGIERTYENGGKYPSSMLADIVPLTKWG